MQADGFADFFKNLGKAAKKVEKKLNIRRRASEEAGNFRTPGASKNSKLIVAICSSREVFTIG